MSQQRRLALVDVEIGPCEHCRQPAAWHTSDGLCGVGRKPRRSYHGRCARAFVDLDSPAYQAAVPDWETVELFRNNAAAQVGL